MAVTSDTEILITQIKKTISLWSDGTLSLDKAKLSYKKLLDQYRKLERKYISENSRGYLKGLLHHHNLINNATLTAFFVIRGETVDPLVFAGDAILLNAIPQKISAMSHDQEQVTQIRLGEREGQAFTLYVRSMAVGRETVITAAVASTPLFNLQEFELLAGLLATLYRKNRELFTPVMLNYINDISSEISRLFNGGKDGPVYTDHFILFNPPGAFSGAGIYNLIDFSHFIVKTLKMTYPQHVNIFAISLSNYFVLYDENTKMGLDIKRNRIDFDYHGNNIPYKVIHTEIGTQQQLYLFLESL
jgi:hypothetical protein